MKLIQVLTGCFFAIVLCAILFPKGMEAKDWKSIPKDPSPYFFADTKRKELIRIDGVRNQNGSFREGMRVYRSVDGKNFSSLTVVNFRTEESSLGENPVCREWIILKDPKDGTPYELYFSKMEWTREPRQNFEVLFLKSNSFGDGDQGVREYVQTYLSGEEIQSLTIQKQ